MDTRTRKLEAYQIAWIGASNPSGILHTLRESVEQCEAENVDPTKDIAVSLMIHQLRTLFFFVTNDPAAIDPSLFQGNIPLTEPIDALIKRIAEIRSTGGDVGGDLLAKVLVWSLYHRTLAHTYDAVWATNGLDAWSKAIYECRDAFEQRA